RADLTVRALVTEISYGSRRGKQKGARGSEPEAGVERKTAAGPDHEEAGEQQQPGVPEQVQRVAPGRVQDGTAGGAEAAAVDREASCPRGRDADHEHD